VRVFVTGAAAYLARPLLSTLCNQSWVSQVRGIDIKPSLFTHPKYDEFLCDTRDTRLGELMRGYQSVIHMAFVVLRSTLGHQRKDRVLVHDINVNGSHRVFEAAAAGGVEALVHLSSASVYGAWADNPPFMTEAQPRRSMPDFAYAQDKNTLEDWLDDFEIAQPSMRVVRLRPHVILGPNAQPFLRRLLQQPFYPSFPSPLPLTQCVWEDDVVNAILACIQRDVRGPFNLGADAALPFRDMLRLTQHHTIGVPFGALRAAHRALWTVSAIGEEPGWLNGMRYSLTVDASRAKRLLDWNPTYSTPQCVQRIAEPPA